jgi:hypothetical protein
VTISAANLRFQDYQFQVQIPTGVWRWTTRMDVSGSFPFFQVRDICSPYGVLRDSIPLPGDVVVAMKESIDQIKENFPPRIFVGPPQSLTFEVDEGRGFSDLQNVILTNDGVFGSILGASLTTSAEYVTVSPANVGNLAANSSGSFDVSVDSTSLLASHGPYSESVTIQDPNASNTPQPLPVTIHVRPKATILALPTPLIFSVTKPSVGPFPIIPPQQLVVQNTGPSGSVLDFQIQKLTSTSGRWLSGFAPVSGTLASGAVETINIHVAPCEGILSGTYEETLRVMGYSTNRYVDVLVRLVVTQ